MNTSEDRAAYLESVLVGGRERVQIRVVDYDAEWPLRFSAMRRRIEAALGPKALAVEHVGSTAVPGLAAKPIVDILLTVEHVDDEPSYRPAIEAAGFQLRVHEADHLMFRTPDRDVHIHVYEPEHPAVGDYLALRDRLRRDAGDRHLYAETKRQLASREWSDMNDYADAKTNVIKQILSRARCSTDDLPPSSTV